MGRAERRRNAKKEKKERKTTYNLTREQLNNMVHERVEDELVRMRQEAMEEAINTAMFLLLTLPLKVLMDHYWKKSYTNRRSVKTVLGRAMDGELCRGLVRTA